MITYGIYIIYNDDSVAILILYNISNSLVLIINLIILVDFGGYMNSIVLKQELKKNFKDYRSLTKKQRAFLNDIGCTVSRQKKHLVLAVPVIRYEKKYAPVTIPCTSSDR